MSEEDLFALPAGGFSLSLDINPQPDELPTAAATNGTVLTMITEYGLLTVGYVAEDGSDDGTRRMGISFSGIPADRDAFDVFTCTADIPADEWSTFVLDTSVSTNGETTLSMGFEGTERFTTNVTGRADYFRGRLCGLELGASYTFREANAPAPTGFTVDNLCVKDGGAVLANWTFEPGSLDEPSGVVVDETARGRVLELLDEASIVPAGGPVVGVSTVPYNDDVAPEVYRQTDPSQPGYHLNLAHAFTRLGDTDGSYTTWALRSDLGESLSDRLVFTLYSTGGKGAQAVFRVVETNAFYGTFASSATVGQQLLPPAPLCYLDEYWNDGTSWASLTANEGPDKCLVYRDRKKCDWARRDGGGFAFYWYKPRTTFDWPDGAAAPSEFVPWQDHDTGSPLPWSWTAHWPDDAEVPTMKVAQTLTKAVNGLPEVWSMSSCGVIYPMRGLTDGTNQVDIVDLVDPTVAQTAALPVSTSVPEDYGFTVGSSGTCQLQKGKYYFTGLPPSIANRFYIDTNADPGRNMVLIGALTEPATGNPYLQLNVLSAEERQALLDLGKDVPAAKKSAWQTAVESLATAPVLPSRTAESTADWTTNAVVGAEVTYAAAYRPNYLPVDHYAVMASGNGAGYVVLIENDATDTSMVAEGNPINVKVLKVVPELYNGTIRPLIDPMNKLSEHLTLQYNEPFGPATTNFVFEWHRRTPEADGTVNTDYASWDVYRTGEGLTSFTLGGTGTTLQELVNTYYILRYRAKEGTAAARTCGTDWSDFTKYTLAEGWVQRVLNAITPFNQRMSDFYSNTADIRYTMLAQIGGPYQGEVALNDANLESIGLLQLYRTVLEKAEKMSIALDEGVNDVDVNKQLLFATSRIADLYMLLGAEAYSDAKNPLISSGLAPDFLDELAQLPSSTFCFQNQVRTLLDEELALLRGRDNSVQNPDMRTTPVFNRLLWNFTKGVTEGEVAYVNNYGIRPDDSGDITVDAAALQYPQGHGDAWGHYLSAVKGYYHLLRNRNFGWSPSMMEMMISQSVVNEDYQDEQKFADAAVKLAQIGYDATDLTARKAWRDNGGDLRSAYFDGSDGENFGYGETASRAALGAAYNWLAVNSILPTNAAPQGVYADKGIRQITRGTATQLDELATAYTRIEDKLNALDSGLNPLGFSQNAIPFDIDPTELEEKNTHFEQILARAEKALENCDAVLEWANKHGARLQQIQNTETGEMAAQAAQEQTYNNALIAIYGTPYAGDIGPGGTYAQGYDGPDLYHYMWMDLGEFGLSQSELKADSRKVTLTFRKWNKDNILVSGTVDNDFDKISQAYDTVTMEYSVAANGIVLPSVSTPGLRTMEGSIQTAYRDYLNDFVTLRTAKLTLDRVQVSSKETIERAIDGFNMKYRINVSKQVIFDAIKAARIAMGGFELADKSTQTLQEVAKDAYDGVMSVTPKIVGAGLAVNFDPSAPVSAAIIGPYVAAKMANYSVRTANDIAQYAAEVAEGLATIALDAASAASELADARESLVSTIKEQLAKVCDAANDYRSAVIALQKSEAAYRAEIAKGDQLQEERANWRSKVAGDAAQLRYLDMYSRVERNNALTKYSTAFDTAQRYVWELAKVYDYETGLLSSDPQGAAKFYAEIIGSRQLGAPGVSTSAATDRGLYDIVNRMKSNFDVLKPRLGMNNPDTVGKKFSLRYELFRIDPGVRGDAAWRTELRKYWRDDINADADFRRYCQPPAGRASLKTPGLVIPFATSVETAKNFFGRSLQGGDHAYSSSDYATKIAKVGVSFAGYDRLTEKGVSGLAADPNVYLVPVGTDYLRAPTASRPVLGYRVIDQVLPLPYTIGSAELDDEDYLTTFSGIDGTSDSAAKIRRQSTLVADGETYSTRLCGRSVWNDRWLLVIPATSLNGNLTEGLETFIKGVSDITVGIEAYSRAGN